MTNGRTDPRSPAERSAISRGLTRSWEARRREVGDLNAEVDRLLTAVSAATQVLAEAERRLISLDSENRRLKHRLGIRTKREQASAELRSVDAAIRREMSGPATSQYELARLYAIQRALAERIARLDVRVLP